MVKKLGFIMLFVSFITVCLFSFHQTSFAQERKYFTRLNYERPHQSICQASGGNFHCTARVIIGDNGKPDVHLTTPIGYGPLQFRTGYNLSGTTNSPKTIAIVDAYDDPNVLPDLNFYSNYFNIPQLVSCPVSGGTAISPCFQKVNQNGGTSYPKRNSGWALEISLDVQIAHAICQNCNILLVEANSASYNDLLAAVDRARLMGTTIISNSYGSSELSTETAYDSYFNHPGVMFVFSSGDSGYGVDYPAASRYVTAVGGTSLYLNSNNSYQSETVWSGTGSGCSRYETKPPWQSGSPLCGRRTVADVSADANPNTGAAIYDSYGYNGWLQVGGTSLSAPLIAGAYALAGTVPSNIVGASLPYSQENYSTNLHDITTGNNGKCNNSYLCTAVPGYDGPSGLGTPNGTGAF